MWWKFRWWRGGGDGDGGGSTWLSGSAVIRSMMTTRVFGLWGVDPMKLWRRGRKSRREGLRLFYATCSPCPDWVTFIYLSVLSVLLWTMGYGAHGEGTR